MKGAFFIVVFSIILAISIDASLFGKIFGRRGPVTEETTVTQDVVAAKNMAYQKWLDAEKGLSDLSNAAWDKLYEGYEAAWETYQGAKEKVAEMTHKSMDTAIKDYEESKEAIKQASKKAEDFYGYYKDKAEEKYTENYFKTLDEVETATAEARKRYNQARMTLEKLYDSSYEAVVEDYRSALQYFSDATDRLQKYSQQKGSAGYEEMKKKLENARIKARDVYRASKKKAEDVKQKIDAFNNEVSDYLETYYEYIKGKSAELLEAMNSYKDDTKAQANEQYEKLKTQLQNASDRYTISLQEAEVGLAYMKDRATKFATDSMESIRLKYKHLKDEL